MYPRDPKPAVCLCVSVVRLSVGASVCLCVYLSVCLSVCLSDCLVSILVRMYVSKYVWMYVCMYLCMYACMYLCCYESMYARMYVSMCACMCVCLCVCMYGWMYVCMSFHLCAGMQARVNACGYISTACRLVSNRPGSIHSPRRCFHNLRRPCAELRPPAPAAKGVLRGSGAAAHATRYLRPWDAQPMYVWMCVCLFVCLSVCILCVYVCASCVCMYVCPAHRPSLLGGDLTLDMLGDSVCSG